MAPSNSPPTTPTSVPIPAKPPLSGTTTIRLHPRTVQAEDFSTSNGIQILNKTDKDGNPFIAAINDGQWSENHRFRLDGCQKLTFHYSSAGPGATVTVTAKGKKIATAQLKPTGDWNKW